MHPNRAIAVYPLGVSSHDQSCGYLLVNVDKCLWPTGGILPFRTTKVVDIYWLMLTSAPGLQESSPFDICDVLRIYICD